MGKVTGIFLSLFLLSAVFTAAGADLTLKNGQVYKNYRMKTIKSQQAVIAFMAEDGSPDIAEINIADLPDDIARALGILEKTNEVPAQADNKPENVTAQVAEQLKNDLALLQSDDASGKLKLLVKFADTLKKGLAAYVSDAEFETIWNGTDGIIAKVTRINRSSFLKLNERVFIRSTSHLGNRFRAQVYAAGCLMQFGKDEMLQVLTFDENSAVKFAMENILSVVDDKTLLKKEENSSSASGQGTPAKLAADSQTAPVITPTVNNYYLYDNNSADDVVYVIRDGRRYILPHHRPGNRPGGKPPVVRPVNPPPRPPVKDKFSKNKSIIQRSEDKIHSYDHLPEWARPRYSRL